MSCSNHESNQNADKQQKQKRFIEKFKSKLIELFFTSNKKITKLNETNTNKTNNNCNTTYSSNSTMYFKDNSISNYYYGYITMNVVNNSKKNSIKRKRQSVSNSNDNISQNSFASSSKSSCINEHDNEYVCDNKSIKNPFLDASLCELLNFDNLNNFSKIKSHFEKFVHTIENENNFFNTVFMTNYISFYLMDNLFKSSFLSENNLNLVTNESYNQVKQIAREIFLQSECEPCGLNGCAIRIFLESETDDFTQMLCNFRFDSSSYLTTFQLDLTILCQYPSNIMSKIEHLNATTQSDNTLAKSLKKSLISFKNSSWDKLPRVSNVCLNGRYYLNKIKLY